MAADRRGTKVIIAVVALALLAVSCRASTQTTLLVDASDGAAAEGESPPGAIAAPPGSTSDAAGPATGKSEPPVPPAEPPIQPVEPVEPVEPTVAPTVPEPSTPERSSPLDTSDRLQAEPTTVPAPAPGADLLGGGGVDFRLERDGIDCSEDALNEYPDTPFLVAHHVVDGNLGRPCFGAPDSRLEQAWLVLAAITPPGQLHDLGLFGGYTSNESGETTLAFVNALDSSGSLYQMSINLDEAEADPDELMLTMAHEFSHVFTSLSTQLDRDVRPSRCETYDNGEGCYTEDSLMYEWIRLFWGNGLIDEIDPYREPTGAAGQARCDRNPGFLGPYAASSPEEDFAETFSAYVFRLPVATPELQAKMNWFAQQPGLVEFKNLAIEAGFGPLDNFFASCG